MEMKCDSHGWVQARHFCHKCVADYLRAVNCHEELVEALQDFLADWDSPNFRTYYIDEAHVEAARAALAKAKEGTADESQMLLQDLDEETL